MRKGQPFPRTGLPIWTPTHSSTPHTVYLCIPLLGSKHLHVHIVCFKSVVTRELRRSCRNYHLCLTGDIRKRKLALHRMSSEGTVVLANESLLLNFHPPLCQVLELKEIIVGIVSVFRKMNY